MIGRSREELGAPPQSSCREYWLSAVENSVGPVTPYAGYLKVRTRNAISAVGLPSFGRTKKEMWY